MKTSILKPILFPLILLGLFFLSALCSLSFFHGSHLLTPVWFSTPFGVLLLLNYPNKKWLGLSFCLGLVSELAYFINGQAMLGIPYAVINLFEIVLLSSVFRYFEVPHFFDLKLEQASILMVMTTVVAPAFRSILGSIWFEWPVFSNASLSCAIGEGIALSSLMPIALSVCQKKWKKTTKEQWMQFLALIIAMGALIWFDLMYFPNAYVLIIVPMLTFSIYYPVFMTLVLCGLSINYIFMLYTFGIYVPLYKNTAYPTLLTYFSCVILLVTPYLMSVYIRIVNLAKDKLLYYATHDFLTGALNRWEFEKKIRLVQQEGKNQKAQHILVYITLDHFKSVNDVVGFSGGDKLLKEVSGLLMSLIDKKTTLARLGGDEFGLLYTNISLDEGYQQAKKLLASIKALRFFWNGKFYSIGASIGLCPFKSSGHSPDQLLNLTDLANQQAKLQNKIIIYRAEDRVYESYQSDIHYAYVLKTACEKNQFLLYAQKIMPLRDEKNAEASYEVLIRLQENGKIINASKFIPIAEQYGVIKNIDKWVLKQVLIVHGKQISQQLKGHIAINLSAHSVMDLHTTDYIIQLIHDTPIPPSKLCFEITETASISDMERSISFIETLHNLGCKVSLDDFGVGFSSLNYLQSFSPDYIKIDGSFVKRVQHSEIDKMIVKTVAQMAKQLGIQTVAECIETEGILQVIRAFEVDYGQGFLIERPKLLKSIFKF